SCGERCVLVMVSRTTSATRMMSRRTERLNSERSALLAFGPNTILRSASAGMRASLAAERLRQAMGPRLQRKAPARSRSVNEGAAFEATPTAFDHPLIRLAATAAIVIARTISIHPERVGTAANALRVAEAGPPGGTPVPV